MELFINDDFLLTGSAARELYHNYAKPLPIIDFHNHLTPKDIAEDRVFGSIAKLWLEGDHYKWRAMRANGIDEEYITGAATDWEKFEKWAETVPKTLRNPLYHWTHLELKRYFGIDKLLNPSTARYIFDHCNEKAKRPEYSVRNLLRAMKVEYLCTTEDPIDPLTWHKHIDGDFEIKVSTAFRPDKIFNILEGGSFIEYILQLEKACGFEIRSYSDLCQALEQRHNFFHDFGSRLSDFALDWFTFVEVSDRVADNIFTRVLLKKEISLYEADAFRTSLLSFLCGLNFDKNWTQQFHLGALRNINENGARKLGEATGFDAINDVSYVAELGKFLNKMELKSKLAKSIFFNLNPRDNAAIATLIHSFNDGSSEGKMQYGPAWWFLDQKDGIERQLNDVSVFGILGNFIGMITDSRSFLSFPRHEYFRRILCNVLGREMEEGLIPADKDLLKSTIENICYYNARRYFHIHNVPAALSKETI